jgi:thiol-disulfide isomerase/thioredoxin
MRRSLILRSSPVCLALLLLAHLGCTNAWCRAVPLTAFDLDGHAVDPWKLSGDKVVVFLFVRTDCPVANRYAPTIQALSAAYAGKASFWLVYPSKAESAERIREHDRDYRYKIPALRDPQRVLVRASEAQVTPEAAVFDASQKLMYHGRIDDWYLDMTKQRSAPTTHELRDAIEAALSGKTLGTTTKPAVGCYLSDLE